MNSYKLNFDFSIVLLCIALVKKYGFNISNIINEFSKYPDNSEELLSKIKYIIEYYQLDNPQKFEMEYETMRKIDFLYNLDFKSIPSYKILEHKIYINLDEVNNFNITSDFYEGFDCI